VALPGKKKTISTFGGFLHGWKVEEDWGGVLRKKRSDVWLLESTRLPLSRLETVWPIRSFSALPLVLTFWQPDVKTGGPTEVIYIDNHSARTQNEAFPPAQVGRRIVWWLD
jgi:hypothetical protein